jgi:hypothetical protein
MAALRSVATESPSGRLVIDISRLRETVATNSDTEMTAIRSGVALGGADGHESGANVAATREPFPRISLSLTGSAQAKKRIKVIATVVAAVLLIGITLAVRSRFAASPADPLVVVSPSPTAEPTPQPSPSPSPSPSPTVEPKKPVQPKKEGKVKSFANKVKRFIKKPF